jgi:hypothetical protein
MSPKTITKSVQHLKQERADALLRRSRAKSAPVVDNDLARSGKIAMTFFSDDAQQCAAELLSNTQQALTIYDHYDQSLTPKDAAEFRGSLLFYIFNHASATDEVAQTIALEAWKNRDWEHIDGVTIYPNDMIATFRSLLEQILPEAKEGHSEMRERWINELGAKVPVLLGPLSTCPIDPGTDKGKRVIKKVRAILQKANHGKGDQSGLAKLNELVESGEPIDHTIFERPGSTSSAREIVSDVRHLKNNDRGEELRRVFALLAYAGEQATIREYKNNFVEPRLPRYPVTVDLVSRVDAKTGELLEQVYDIHLVFSAKDEYILERTEKRTFPVFEFQPVQTRVERVIQQPNS